MKRTPLKSDGTLAQQCYEHIKQDIIEGILKPGEKLKIEPLKERFCVGQSPLREALSRLVASGFVDALDNKGFRVALLSESQVRDTYDIFTRIENCALALAIERGDAAWQAGIVAALHTLSLIENNPTAYSYHEWAQHNYTFHCALIAGCNSPQLLEIRRRLYLQFDRYCRMAIQLTTTSLPLNNKEHTELAQLVLKRNTAEAIAHMTHHINGALEEVIQQFNNNNVFGEHNE